jgi:hypothetical protein
MNMKIMPGTFVKGEVVSLPGRHGPGMIRWQTEKDGSYFRAPFRFEGGHKIASRDGGDPWFVDGRRESIDVGSWLIAIVRPGRAGVFVSAWGHLAEYEEIVGEPKPAPELPGRAHILVKKAPPVKPVFDAPLGDGIKKFHHGSRPPLPRRCMTVAAMVNAGHTVAV